MCSSIQDLHCENGSDDPEVPYNTFPDAVAAEKIGVDVDPTQVTVTEPVPAGIVMVIIMWDRGGR